MSEHLAAAGVEVEQMTYEGVTHEFFGMGTVVPQAQEAVDMATANLREAFGEAGDMNADATEEMDDAMPANDGAPAEDVEPMDTEAAPANN